MRVVFLPSLFYAYVQWQLCFVSAANLPPITCPKNFQYLTENGEFIGKITLFNLPNEAIHIDLLLSLHIAPDGYFGNLTLFEDKFKTGENLKEKKPVAYRVTFPSKTELPKVTKITVNGIQICSGTNYPEPSSQIALTHSFFPTHIPENERIRRPFPAGFNLRYKFGAHDDTKKEQTTAATTTTTPKKKTVAAQPPPQTAATTFSTPTTSSSSNTECGRVDSDTTPFIFGGTVLRRGEFPWLVAIYRKHYTGLQFICGGSLVSTRTVLTAGHCFKLYSLRAQQIVSYLGRHNLENYSEDGVVTREVEKLVIHPDYDAHTYPDADLALMQLSAPVSFGHYIKPICLWSESDDASLIVGKSGVVAGWGADENGRAVSPLPKWVETDIVSEVDCLKTVEAFKKLTSPRTICAGKRDGTGPCMGDSGGGLMIKRDGRWMIRGIVSAGQTIKHTCNLREYVIYCDLAKHLTWIQSNLLN